MNFVRRTGRKLVDPLYLERLPSRVAFEASSTIDESYEIHRFDTIHSVADLLESNHQIKHIDSCLDAIASKIVEAIKNGVSIGERIDSGFRLDVYNSKCISLNDTNIGIPLKIIFTSQDEDIKMYTSEYDSGDAEIGVNLQYWQSRVKDGKEKAIKEVFTSLSHEIVHVCQIYKSRYSKPRTYENEKAPRQVVEMLYLIEDAEINSRINELGSFIRKMSNQEIQWILKKPCGQDFEGWPKEVSPTAMKVIRILEHCDHILQLSSIERFIDTILSKSYDENIAYKCYLVGYYANRDHLTSSKIKIGSENKSLFKKRMSGVELSHMSGLTKKIINPIVEMLRGVVKRARLQASSVIYERLAELKMI